MVRDESLNDGTADRVADKYIWLNDLDVLSVYLSVLSKEVTNGYLNVVSQVSKVSGRGPAALEACAMIAEADGICVYTSALVVLL